MNHEGKCKNLHGHQYEIEIHVRGELDKLGRVVDFGVIKEKVGKWIDLYLDHGFLYCAADSEVTLALAKVQGQKKFAMKDNPTAENIATMILLKARSLLKAHRIDVFKVVCHETPNCRAEVEAE